MQEALAQMRESRSDYGNAHVLLCLCLAALHAQGYAAGVWGDGADFESLTETLNCSNVAAGKFPLEDVTALWVDTSISNLLIHMCVASFTKISGPMENGQGFRESAKECHRARLLK